MSWCSSSDHIAHSSSSLSSSSLELQVQFTILNAKDLPKTDRLSPIDAYVVFYVPTQNNKPQKTRTIDNNSNPNWNSSHPLFVNYDPQSPSPFPKITLELWDANVFSKDEKVSVAELQLLPSHLQNPGIIEIPLQHIDSKYSNSSVLFVRFGEYAYSSRCLYNLISPQYPGVQLSHEGLGRVSFPDVKLAIEYETTGVDIKLYITKPSTPIFVDMVRTGHATSQVRRRNVEEPFKVDGIKVYEEIKMNDIPFSVISQPGRVLFYVFQKQLLKKESLDTVVTRHGWAGSMSWSMASTSLKNVELDTKEEEIYMKMDDSFIVVDFDAGNVDMKCVILDVPQNSEIAYDFAYEGEDVKKTSEIYFPSKQILANKYTIQRKLELDDIPYGTPFDCMTWYKYKITSPMQVDIFDLVKLHPF